MVGRVKGGGNPKGWGVNARYLAIGHGPVRLRWRVGVGLVYWKTALLGIVFRERWREICALFKDFLEEFVGK